MRSHLLAAGICCVLVATAGCADQRTGHGSAGSGQWRALAGAPLSPRQDATGLWTGAEALFIGGSDEQPCPVNADCPLDATPRSDGAAVDPRTGRWRRIASAPVPLLGARGAVLGQTAYLLPGPASEPGPVADPGSTAGAGPVADRRATELLAYDLKRDRWTRIAAPFPADAGYALLAAGRRLIAYATIEETGPAVDFELDPDTGKWSRLPDDPLDRAFDRTMVWTGWELVIIDKDLTPDPGADRPAVARAAVLNPATGTWRRLPDSELLGTSPWLVDEGRLVNPTLGGADGGRIGNWGRVYPYGGILDLGAGAWTPLPDPPVVRPPADQRAGAFGTTAAVYSEAGGPVLDVPAGRWLHVPMAPGGRVTGRTVLAAGTSLLAYGGASWTGGAGAAGVGTLLSDAWLWTPPGRSGGG